MMKLGPFTARLDAPPEAVFARLTDVGRLSEWNVGIPEVVDDPGPLSEGTVWRVRIRAMGTSWISRSEVAELDAAGGRFTYRSQSDDGNPSFADWSWQVSPEGQGSSVTVICELNPKTFWRKHLLSKIRRRSLEKEVQASLASLDASLAAGSESGS